MNLSESIKRMQELSGFGLNQVSEPKRTGIVEFKASALDNKSYGVVREANKYYIKESVDGLNFNFIGGIANKREYEYDSYNTALKNLEFKVRSINESIDPAQTFEATIGNVEQSEYIVEATMEMREQLNRFNEIMNNTSKIMNESEFIPKPKFKVPEAPATATDPEKMGDPFEEKTESQEEKFDIEFTNKAPETLGDPFEEKPKGYASDSAATKKPSGGKKIYKISEDQFNRIMGNKKTLKEFDAHYFGDDDFSDADEYDNTYTGDLLDKFNDVDGLDHEMDLSSEIQFNEEDIQGITEAVIREFYDEYGFEDEYENTSTGDLLKQFDYDLSGEDNYVPTESDYEDEMIEQVVEAVMSEFGKHPSYQKPAFTTGKVEAELVPGTEDREDASVKSTEPYGKKIGDGDPFNHEIAKKITEAVLNVFGQHPTYQKPAFTTGNVEIDLVPGTEDREDDSVKSTEPYGKKIGVGKPFTIKKTDKLLNDETTTDEIVESIMKKLKKKA